MVGEFQLSLEIKLQEYAVLLAKLPKFFGQPVDDQTIWQEYRRVRAMFLEQSDWTQNQDNTLTPEQREAWRVYRQQLRDLPQDYPDPKTVVWPTKPE